jgi:hypothetical protein
MARRRAALITALACLSASGAGHAQAGGSGPFDWTPSYGDQCLADQVAYACRVVADGQELYANIPNVNGLFHFSLIGQSHPCPRTREEASCGKLLMAQPNNGRDVINFAYKKTRAGWNLDEINNALGGPNEHLKLWIPIPTTQTPACAYNGTQQPCIILSGKNEGIAGFPPSSKYTRGHGFQLIYMRNWRGKESYDAVLYQAVGRPQNCGSEKACQTGDMQIYDYNGGYEHITRASYRVSDGIWRIQSSLGNQLSINLGGPPATRK